MPNAFDSYLKAKQNAMQEGQNMLLMEQAARKIQRDNKMRNILANTYTPAETLPDYPAQTMPAAEAMGPIPQVEGDAYLPGEALRDYPAQTLPAAAAHGPVRPGRFSMENALSEMYKQGLGVEALPLEMQMQAAGKSKRDILLKDKLKRQQAKEMFDLIKSKGGDLGPYKTKIKPSGVEFEIDPYAAKKADLEQKKFEYETGTNALSRIPSRISDRLPQKMRNEIKSKELGAIAAKEGAALGEAKTKLETLKANLPRLKTVVKQLSKLGKKATYTYLGQGLDFAGRQAGITTEGAIARKEYISKVDNEILPLLKQTFGAAFTVKEGESLKATLGDPNASPEEKDAVLRSFIDSKNAQIETMQRRAGEVPRESLNIQDLVDKYAD